MHIKHLESAWGGEVSVIELMTDEQVKNVWFNLPNHSSFVGKVHSIAPDQGESNFSSDSYVPLCFPEGCYLNELGVQQIRYETGIHITIQILHSNNNWQWNLFYWPLVQWLVLLLGDNNRWKMITDKRKKKERSRAKESMCSMQWNYHLQSWDNTKLAVKFQQHCQMDS